MSLSSNKAPKVVSAFIDWTGAVPGRELVEGPVRGLTLLTLLLLLDGLNL